MKRQKRAVYGLMGAFAASLLALSPVASADMMSFNLGNYTLAGSAFANGVFDTTGTGQFDSFKLSFDYSEDGIPDGSWASDLQVKLTDPSGDMFTVGGFDNPATTLWSFDGSVSDLDGFYSTTFTPAAGFGEVGNYAFMLTNDWAADSNPNSYNNFTLMYDFTPGAPSVSEPSILALFAIGVLGLGVRGRRRRIR